MKVKVSGENKILFSIFLIVKIKGFGMKNGEFLSESVLDCK